MTKWVVQRESEGEQPDETDSPLTPEEAEELARKWKEEQPKSVVRILRCPQFPSTQGCEELKVF